MNERIIELAKKAGAYVSLSYEHENELILSGADDIKKFAELIVKECVDVIYEDGGATHHRELLFTNFGVEE